jgi:hypothetical protein
VAESTGRAEALIGANTTIGTAASRVGDVSVKATGDTRILPYIDGDPMGIALAGGLLAGSAGVTTVTIGGTGTTAYVRAEIGANAVIEAYGALEVRSASVWETIVEVDGGAVGAIAIGAVVDRADVKGTTRAQVGSGTRITAGAVTVYAENTSNATVSMLTAGGGIIAGRGGAARAYVEPRIEAVLAADTVVTATRDTARAGSTGDVTVHALSRRAEGNATAKSFGGGGIDVGVIFAEVTASPTVDAHIGARARVNADGTVAIRAQALSEATGTFPESFSPTAAMIGADAIIFAGHGLVTGDRVTYSANGNTAIGLVGGGSLTQCDLVNEDGACREYGAIVVDKNTIRLGQLFSDAAVDTGGLFPSASGVDAARDVIRFAAAHNLVSGDPVVYVRADGVTTGVPGVVAATYYVRVIDAFTIKLFISRTDALADPRAISPAVSGDAITLTGHGLANGTAVAYYAPAPIRFTTRIVESSPNPSFDKDNPDSHPYFVGTNDNSIYFGRDSNGDGTIDAGHGLSSGDKIIYRTSGTPIGGLSNGQAYWAIRVDDRVLRLAASRCEALGSPGGSDACALPDGPDSGSDPDPRPVTAVTLTPDKSPAGLLVQHAFEFEAIGGLSSGVTYYVSDATANTFKLALTPGGTARTLDGAGRIGAHRIGRAGVELTGRIPTTANPSKLHELHIAFTGTAPSGQHLLLGPGGVSLRTIHMPPGDGISSATTEGGSGGLGVISVPTSEVIANADVRAYIVGSATPTVINAGGGVEISSKSVLDVSAYTSNLGIGGIAAGEVDATTDVDNISRAYVGSGGVVIRAAGAFKVTSETSTRTNVTANADSVGLGAGADAETDSLITQTTEARIGSSADIEAGSVQVYGHVSRLAPRVRSNAFAGGFVAVAIADANIDTTSTVTAGIDGSSRVTGFRGVDLRAVHVAIANERFRRPIPIGFIPIPIWRGDDVNRATAIVDTDSGSLVIAGVRADSAAATTGLVTSAGNIASLALYAQARVGEDEHSGTITWDADVVILGGMDGQPLLVVDSSGIIRAINAVKLNGGSTPAVGTPVDPDGDGVYVVEPIRNTGYGNVLFTSSDSIGNGTANGGAVRWPLFHFRDTLASVTIIDHSGKQMRLGAVNVVNDLAGGEPLVQLTTAAGKAPIEFDLRNSVAPALVDIQKLGAGDVVLTGDVNNPVGLTRIINTLRDIVSAPGASARVTTNLFDVERRLARSAATTPRGSRSISSSSSP